jgi:hypothetical protein
MHLPNVKGIYWERPNLFLLSSYFAPPNRDNMDGKMIYWLEESCLSFTWPSPEINIMGTVKIAPSFLGIQY